VSGALPRVLAFSARGRFAAHRDPSVTTHQLVYYAPPKSAIVGMVGAILGTPRSETGELYSPAYVELLSSIRVGIGMLNGPENRPQKVLFGTNRRTLEDTGHMKPTKSELVENPDYRIYVTGKDETIDELRRRIDGHDPAYPVYFGHAYCQARVEDARVDDAQKVNGGGPVTVGTTVLRDPDAKTQYGVAGDSVIVENKMVHNERGGIVERRSIPHMIPLRGTGIKVGKTSSKWQEFLQWDADEKRGDAGVFSVF